MGISVVAMKLRLVAIRRLLVVWVFVAVIVVFQCCWTTYKSLLGAGGSSVAFPVEVSISGNSENESVYRSPANNVMVNATFASHSKEYASEKEADLDHELESNRGIKVLDAGFSMSDKLGVGKEPSNGSRIESVAMEPRLLKSPLMDTSSTRSELAWPTSITHMSSWLQSFNSSSMV